MHCSWICSNVVRLFNCIMFLSKNLTLKFSMFFMDMGLIFLGCYFEGIEENVQTKSWRKYRSVQGDG